MQSVYGLLLGPFLLWLISYRANKNEQSSSKTLWLPMGLLMQPGLDSIFDHATLQALVRGEIDHGPHVSSKT